jgi:glycosyltransferase involved in cell wall biosynthesis
MIPVSVCLTTYNRASVLAKTVDSILGQTFGDFELIINDDRSTDCTEGICRDYEERDKRVKYFCNSENLKMPGNLNAAIRRASGVYVANLHDGDIYRSDLIAKWKEALDTTPGALFVFNAYDALNPDGSHRLYKEPFESTVPGVYIARMYFQSLTSCVWGTVMARASAYQEFGPFDSTFGFISDVDMWLRLAKGRDVAYVPEPLITVTQREPNHPFASYSWDHLFWQFGIYNRHIEDYSRLYSDQVSRSSSDYQSMLRRLFFTAMLSLIKKQNWSRMREGFAIWRDAKDPFLKVPGILFGREESRPSWYDSSWWNIAKSSQGSSISRAG